MCVLINEMNVVCGYLREYTVVLECGVYLFIYLFI